MDLIALNEFAARYTTAWGSQAPERVAAFYAEDGSLSINDGPPAMGRQAIAEVARGFMSAFPDMEVTVDELVRNPDERDGTEFHWTLAGTNTGPGGTGKRVRISGYELWQMGDAGLIRHSKGFFDRDDYERQLTNGVASY